MDNCPFKWTVVYKNGRNNEVIFKEPEREFHIREISKIFKKSPTTISKYLFQYKKEGLLKAVNKLNHLLYRADTSSSLFKQAKLNYNIRILYESGLIDYLIEEFNNPESIIIFGSFAKAEDILSSDIDILIISPVKKELNLEKFEGKLGRKIQLFIHSSGDIEKMKKENKELLNNFINGIKIYGFWEVFKWNLRIL